MVSYGSQPFRYKVTAFEWAQNLRFCMRFRHVTAQINESHATNFASFFTIIFKVLLWWACTFLNALCAWFDFCGLRWRKFHTWMLHFEMLFVIITTIFYRNRLFAQETQHRRWRMVGLVVFDGKWSTFRLKATSYKRTVCRVRESPGRNFIQSSEFDQVINFFGIRLGLNVVFGTFTSLFKWIRKNWLRLK